MMVDLSWPALDTAKIKNYAVYCNRSRNLDPVALVDKSATTCSFDIFASPIDTFQYQISAIGKDGIEGPSTAGKLFTTSGVFDIDTISCSVLLTAISHELSFDHKDNIFAHSGNSITKLDSKGNLLNEFAFSEGTAIVSKSVRIDTSGSIYALVGSGNSRSLLKFDNDLRVIRELQLDSAYNFSLAVSSEGAFMLYSTNRYRDSRAFGTQRWKYDPQFNLVEKDTLADTLFINHSVVCKDTTVCCLSTMQTAIYRIVYFDRAFKEISSPVTINALNRFEEYASSVPRGYSPFSSCYLVMKGLFAIIFFASESSPMLLFFNDLLQPVARVPFDFTGFDLYHYFDCKGNSFRISKSGNNRILKCSTANVLGNIQ